MPLGPACRHCATPLPDNSTTRCGYCIKRLPALDEVFTPYRFEEPLRTLLHDFKYREKLHLAPYLAQHIQRGIPPSAYQNTCFMPVPMHPKRMRARGFNQAALLAKCLAKALKKPYLAHHMRKIKSTPPQAKLEAKIRRENLRGSFKIKAITYPHITLIDDLITTGSTAHELAYQLKKQGVQTVNLWCMAKTCLN